MSDLSLAANLHPPHALGGEPNPLSNRSHRSFHRSPRNLNALIDTPTITTLTVPFSCTLGTPGQSHAGAYLGSLRPILQQWLGYSESELLDSTFLTYIHPDDRASSLAALDPLCQGVPGCYFEHRLLARTGDYRWIAWTIALLPESSQLVAIAREMTAEKQSSLEQYWDRQHMEVELRRSEERYRCLAECIPQLIWTTDAEGGLDDINHRWIDYTGLNLVELRQDGWQKVLHPDDLAPLLERWHQARAEGRFYQAETRLRAADGSYRWFLAQAIPLRNEQGQVVRWFGTSTDINAQKQLEAEQSRSLQLEQAARAEAEKSNQVKNEFISVLSHELRTPLNPVVGWVKLLRAGSLSPEKMAVALETIDRCVHLQVQLIDDLLDFSRMLQGKLTLTSLPLNLKVSLEAAIANIRLAADAKGIAIHLPADTPDVIVLGDGVRLQQVFWNLLSNAIKFTPTGGRVEVKLERQEGDTRQEEKGRGQKVKGKGQNEQEQNGQDSISAPEPSAIAPPPSALSPESSAISSPPAFALLTVSDTGKGIDPVFLPYVFDYFRQADGTLTRKFGGLGLGLAITRHLVELHGGIVSASSPGEGQGATFRVQLPLLPG